MAASAAPTGEPRAVLVVGGAQAGVSGREGGGASRRRDACARWSAGARSAACPAATSTLPSGAPTGDDDEVVVCDDARPALDPLATARRRRRRIKLAVELIEADGEPIAEAARRVPQRARRGRQQPTAARRRRANRIATLGDGGAPRRATREVAPALPRPRHQRPTYRDGGVAARAVRTASEACSRAARLLGRTSFGRISRGRSPDPPERSAGRPRAPSIAS